MPELDEADPQSGAPPAEPQDESFAPDDSAQPVELQSPEGELPPDALPPDAEQDDGAQPNQAATAEEPQPEQVVPQAEPLAAAEEGQPDGAQSVEITPSEEPPEDVAQLGKVALPEEELQQDVAQSVEIAPGEETQPETPALEPPRQLSRRERETVERQNRRFAACGRCGYFVADCRNYLGEAALVEAMLDSGDGWLRLEGDETFRRLLMYAYGIQIDAGYDLFDGSCPECRRRFVYIARADHPTRLKIQI